MATLSFQAPFPAGTWAKCRDRDRDGSVSAGPIMFSYFVCSVAPGNRVGRTGE